MSFYDPKAYRYFQDEEPHTRRGQKQRRAELEFRNVMRGLFYEKRSLIVKVSDEAAVILCRKSGSRDWLTYIETARWPANWNKPIRLQKRQERVYAYCRYRWVVLLDSDHRAAARDSGALPSYRQVMARMPKGWGVVSLDENGCPAIFRKPASRRTAPVDLDMAAYLLRKQNTEMYALAGKNRQHSFTMGYRHRVDQERARAELAERTRGLAGAIKESHGHAVRAEGDVSSTS